MWWSPEGFGVHTVLHVLLSHGTALARSMWRRQDGGLELSPNCVGIDL